MVRNLSKYADKVVVIKYGGNAMLNEQLQMTFARNVAELVGAGVRPVIVHGGAPQINSMLTRLGIASEFVNGMRMTNLEAIEVVEMVLSGSVNKTLVELINQAGVKAVGLSGKDASLLRAKRLPPILVRDSEEVGETNRVDLGFVGSVESVQSELLSRLIYGNFVPVIAPIALSHEGETLNINADLVAGALAAELKAEALLLLTNTDGVLDQQGVRFSSLKLDRVASLIADGTISGGMLPKIECAMSAVKAGVKCSQILDGRKSHALIEALSTEHEIGTVITN